jgi:hypothetical protein
MIMQMKFEVHWILASMLPIQKKNKIIITINCPPDLYKRLQF